MTKRFFLDSLNDFSSAFYVEKVILNLVSFIDRVRILRKQNMIESLKAFSLAFNSDLEQNQKNMNLLNALASKKYTRTKKDLIEQLNSTSYDISVYFAQKHIRDFVYRLSENYKLSFIDNI